MTRALIIDDDALNTQELAAHLASHHLAADCAQNVTRAIAKLKPCGDGYALIVGLDIVGCSTRIHVSFSHLQPEARKATYRKGTSCRLLLR